MNINDLKEYRIYVVGCDDTTVIDMKLTDDEAELINRVADKVTEASEYRCMPRMYIDPIEEEQA